MSGTRVLTYLDCGCAIRQDGSRAWCPSCLSPTPAPDPVLVERDACAHLCDTMSDQATNEAVVTALRAAADAIRGRTQ